MFVYFLSWPHLCVVVQLRPLLRLVLHVPVEAVVVVARLRRLGRGSERLHGAVGRAVFRLHGAVGRAALRLLQQQVRHAAGELPTADTGELGACNLYDDRETDDSNV